MTSTFQDRTGSIAGQLAIKAPVAVATTENITLSGEQTIDGVLTAESRILVKDQTITTQNGIYNTSSGAWTRALDFDGSRDAVKGLIVGSTGNNKTYRLTSANPVVFDSSAITWAEYTVASALTGGLLAMGTNVASATTTNLGATDSDYVTVTGTTTITGLGATTTKNHVWVKFSGILILTHNATSLILPTGANITTAVGDVAEFVRISDSNWQCLSYLRADGTPVQNQFFRTEVNLASAATTTLPATSNIVQITGTTTITSLGSSASATYPLYFLRFNNELILTYSSTILTPTQANISTRSGDTAVAQYLGSGNWKIISYTLYTGKQLAAIARGDLPDGSIVNRNYATYSASADLTVVIPIDDTLPQSGEGTEIVTVSITPTSATNRIRVSFFGFGSGSSGAIEVAAAMFIDSAADAVQATCATPSAVAEKVNLSMVYEYVPGDTSAHTYKIRVGGSTTAAVRMNGSNTARLFGGASAATLIVEEIKAS